MRKSLGTKGVFTAPQPVLLVGTYDENGVANLMNVAWGGQCSEKHVALNLGHERQTLENMRRTKTFTVMFATEETMVQADYVGIVSGLKVHDKVAKSGLTPMRAEMVNAPAIEQLPVTLECRLSEERETPTGEVRVVGEVVNISADESVLNEKGRVDFDKMHLICFDEATLKYRRIGEIVGNAFVEGNKIRKA
ncbi:MAG: flavin reductase [Bacteroidaceae bacterium]|nr:flavin reductase [Bacteroidaceae bacterium]